MSGTTNRDWVYYTLISIPSLFTLIGLMYMIQKVCSPKMRECCLDLEKEDINNEYGTYYDTNGEMRQNVMEVTFYLALHNQHFQYEIDFTGPR